MDILLDAIAIEEITQTDIDAAIRMVTDQEAVQFASKAMRAP